MLSVASQVRFPGLRRHGEGGQEGLLQPEGPLVMDVFNPTQWVRWAGERSHHDAAPELGYPYRLRERTWQANIEARVDPPR